MVHERNEELTCGPIMAQGGIQAMETMLFTIDHVNKQPWWIKNITLGTITYYCQIHTNTLVHTDVLIYVHCTLSKYF